MPPPDPTNANEMEKTGHPGKIERLRSAIYARRIPVQHLRTRIEAAGALGLRAVGINNPVQWYQTLMQLGIQKELTVVQLTQPQAFVIFGIGVDSTNFFTSSISRVQSTKRPSSPAPLPAAR